MTAITDVRTDEPDRLVELMVQALEELQACTG